MSCAVNRANNRVKIRSSSIQHLQFCASLAARTLGNDAGKAVVGLVRYKDEPGARFGKQYVTATNAYEAMQMAKALYGKLLISEGASLA